MSTDLAFERRLHDLYAVAVPTALDRRIATLVASVPARRPSRARARRIAVFAIAAVLATVAAGPVASWFAGWDPYYDRMWELGTPVDQTATVDDYQVTVHRTYADALGVRVAVAAVDLQDRWSEFAIESAAMTDSEGRVYEPWNWSLTKAPADASVATWSRFMAPRDAPTRDLQLRLTVTALAVRAPAPLIPDLDAHDIWTTVAGDWTFDVAVPVVHAGRVIEPVASVTVDGITVTMREIGLMPSGPFARIVVQGLPEPAAGADRTVWNTNFMIEHDGQGYTDHVFDGGAVAGGKELLVEIVRGDDFDPYIEDISGHWTVTIPQFNAFDPATERVEEVIGPWVLDFDVRPESAP